MTTTTNKAIGLELGYINVEKIKAIFSDYTESENEFGVFLQVQGNAQHGVLIYTNAFESKKHLKKYLFNALLISL
jgi:hypothetical protein